MGNRIRVLWVLGNLSTGGVETWLKSIYIDLLVHDIELHILLTNPLNKGEMFHSFQSIGIPIYHLPYTVRKIITFTFYFKRLLRKWDFNIVHEHGDFAGCLKFILQPGLKNKLFIHIHSSIRGVEEYYFRKRLINRLLWKISYTWFKNSRKILGTSSSALKEFNLLDRYNADTLYCSVREEFVIKKYLPKEVDLLFIGRLDEYLDFNAPNNHKNSWFALNVMAKCLEINENLKCVFIGGPQKRLDELRIQKLPLIEKISFQSNILNPVDIFAQSRIVIFPSAHEGFGLVAVEAQLQGCFVLASDKVSVETKISDNIQYLPLNDLSLWSQKVIDLLQKTPSFDVNRSKFSPSQSSMNLKIAYESF
jgi:hypothetical protein